MTHLNQEQKNKLTLLETEANLNSSLKEFKKFLNQINILNGNFYIDQNLNESFISWEYDDHKSHIDASFISENNIDVNLYFKDDESSVGLEAIDLEQFYQTIEKYIPEAIQ